MAARRRRLLAEGLAIDSGARVLVTDDAARGVDGVDFVYTDVWVSMGESDGDWATRVPGLIALSGDRSADDT